MDKKTFKEFCKNEFEAHGFKKQRNVFYLTGHMMKGGTIVDATIINAPSSTKNAEKAREH